LEKERVRKKYQALKAGGKRDSREEERGFGGSEKGERDKLYKKRPSREVPSNGKEE